MSNSTTYSRCDHQGDIELLRVKRLNQVVRVCDECRALWLGPLREHPVHGIDFVDFGAFLREYGIALDPAEWEAADAPSSGYE